VEGFDVADSLVGIELVAFLADDRTAQAAQHAELQRLIKISPGRQFKRQSENF
jgi:hypothetical protein